MSALRRTTFVGIACAFIVLGALVPAGPASADEHQVAAFFIDYLPRNVDINQGDTLMFANTDPFAGPGHSVTHQAAPGETPKFDTGIIPFGSSMDIPGIADLKKGDYLIACQVHPIMRGYLSVGGAPRPITDAVKDFLGL